MKYRHIILGGTGHIGSALADTLLSAGETVMIIGHDPKKGEHWTAKGAGFEVADILDSSRLHELFGRGERLFILNPPAPPSTDTVAEETKSMSAIINALQDTKPEKIVAASTYGAQPGDQLGDLGVLYQMEQQLASLQTPQAVIRSAYYMSNWDMALSTIKESGMLPTLYPPGFKLPMVAPADIGKFAATLMLNDETGLHFIEGPEPYSPDDVAAAFGEAFNKTVTVATTPEDEWQAALEKAGFSAPAATSMANVTRITKTMLQNGYKAPNPHRGQTTLRDYIKKLAE